MLQLAPSDTEPGHSRFPHLDCLRALAVVLVLLFHLKVPGFKAGYLGVDLFFMLSGFLMTWTMLLHRQQHGQFRVRAFFQRRLRRIAPSLVLTVLVTLLVAFAMMSPQHLFETAKQAESALMFYANVFFYNRAGYFAQEREVTALLHMWSLSVEEQFYLVFGTVLLLGKRWHFGWLLASLLIVSIVLAAAAYVTIVAPERSLLPFGSVPKANDALFFLLPYRMVQFAAGAVCSWAVWNGIYPRYKSFGPLALIAAFGSLLWISLSPAAERWSMAITLLPFVALLVPTPYVGRLGTLAPVQQLARISYQVYLVHWPLIVFWRYWTFRELGAWEMCLVGALSVLGGWLLATIVSRPLFSPRELRPLLFRLAVLTTACTGLLTLAISTKGMPSRIPAERQLMTSTEMRERESAYCRGTHKKGETELGGSPDSPLITCSRAGNERQIFVWGDSHARHLLPGVSEVFPETTVNILYFTSCPPQSGFGKYVYDHDGRKALADACVARNREALSKFERHQPTTIILHQFAGYPGDDSSAFIDASQLLLERLQRVGHAVTWIGAVPYPDRLLADCSVVPSTYSNVRLERRCAGNETAFNLIAMRNAQRAMHFAGTYVDVTEQFCPNATYLSCAFVKGGIPLFRDKHHLTVAQSISVVRANRNRISLP